MARKNRRKHYLGIRGKFTYVIKARTKEEALRLAEERFEHEMFDTRQTFVKSGLAQRIRGMVGFEAERGKGKDKPLEVEWENIPGQGFKTGDDQNPAHPRPVKKKDDNKTQKRLET